MTWVFLSLLGVFGLAAMSIGQQILKADTIPMLFWLRVTSVIILCFFILKIQLPTSLVFYSACVAYGFLIVLLDIRNFKFISHHGAALPLRLATAMCIPSFFLWLMIDEETRHLYINHPLTSIAIFFFICLAAYCASQLRKCLVTVNAVKELWPVMLHGMIGPVFIKLVVVAQPHPIGAIFSYIIITSLVSMFVLSFHMLRHPSEFRAISVDTKNIKTGIILSFFSLVAIISSYLAYNQVLNPSYVAVMMMTTPVVVSFYNYMVGFEDKSNKVAGFGILLCATGIALLKL
jgi:hypothetical protein